MDRMVKIGKYLIGAFGVLIVIGLFMPSSPNTASKSETKVETTQTKEVSTSTVEKVKKSIWDSQATQMANRYLDVSAYSHDGLIEQLTVGSGFSKDEATKAVDSLDVDWNEQALRMAKRYLEVSSFSHDGLIEQLVVGSHFTKSQAVYAVSKL